MKRVLIMLTFALLAAGLVACGSDDSGDSTGAEAEPAAKTAEAAETAESNVTEAETLPTTKKGIPIMDDQIYDAHVRYAADPEGTMAFFISEASASPGKIAFQFVNPTNVPHNVAVEAPNGEIIGETETIGEGATTTHLVVKPGEYVLFCSVPGHRKAGMVGHLTVN